MMAQAFASDKRVIYLVCIAAFVCNVLFWIDTHKVKAEWANVPPVPPQSSAAMITLGDRQFAYRINGIMLQNLGDTGGRVTGLQDYNYSELGRWFFLQDRLDPVSNYIPLLAAFYFGATENKEDLIPVVDYLATVGQRTEGQKWRWLAQAVYLSRFKQGDLNKALDLAYKLAAMDLPNMPAWTDQMPAFIMMAKGEKPAALEIILSIMRDQADKVDPAEMVFMRSLVCERLITPQEAEQLELCKEPY